MTDARFPASSIAAAGTAAATAVKAASLKNRSRTTCAALAVLGGILLPAHAQVVADSACPRYAADIEAFATCEGDRVVAPAALPGTHAGAAIAPRAAAEQRAALALHAMWLPLLDDERPAAAAAKPNRPRWCGPNTRVLVAGRPFEAGRDVTQGGQALDWTLDDCRPPGARGLRLHGTVSMHLVRDDEHGVTAIVQPRDLRVTSDGVTETLSRPFAAALHHR